MGGLYGGVVGLSFDGLSVLPPSSVIPGVLPVAEPPLSEPELASGAEVLFDSLVLNRACFVECEKDDGADFRLSADGGLYECACGSTAVRGGGECRMRTLRLAKDDLSSYVFERLSSEALIGHELTAGCAVCG